jgi:hypothetical protein
MNTEVMRSIAERPDPAMRLSCAQVWAGNRQRISLLELPGLTAWVFSSAAGPGTAGGDVHYISVCPRCLVTRVALADVSGHGHSVATFSNELGSLIEKHLHGSTGGIPWRALRDDGRHRLAPSVEHCVDEQRRPPSSIVVQR